MTKTRCEMCAQVGIETVSVVVARDSRGGQSQGFCFDCASQGPAESWEEWEVIDGAIPEGSPWALAARVEWEDCEEVPGGE